MRKQILTLPLLISLGLASGHAAALGLGQIEVQSRLNQPLVAEIPLLQVAPGELDRLHVRLASPEAFARVGLDRPGALTANLQFEVGTNAQGSPVIRVTTPSRVNDPFISFLLEIEWGAGRLVREYNVLLDPPYMAPATRVEVAPATVSPPTAPRPAPAPAPVPVPQAPAPAAPEPAPATQTPAPAVAAPAPAPARASAPAPTAAAASSATAGPVTVASGQTLFSIANRHRDGDVSVNQMMIALLRANPDAFIDGNINLLRAGAVLRMPQRDEVLALRAAEANAIVSEQSATWQARRAPAPQPAESAATPAPGRALVTEDEARLAVVAPSGEDEPRALQTGAAQGGEGTRMRVELTQAEEEIAAREAEIEEMRSRMDELEALAESQARMIELRNQEMEDLQRQLQQARQGEASGAAADTVPAARPWYASPFTLGGLALLVIGALVWAFRRDRRQQGPVLGGGRAGTLAASIESARSAPGSTAESDVDDDLEPEERAPLDDAPIDAGDDVFEPADPADEQRSTDSETPVPVHVDEAGHAAGTSAAGWLGRDADSQAWTAAGVTSVYDGPASEDDAGPGRPVQHAAEQEVTTSSFDGEPLESTDEDGALSDTWDPEPLETSDAQPQAAASDDWAIEPVSDADAEPTQEIADEADFQPDSVGTKLELARAYIDIGDADGARAMLDEVVQEGTASQQDEARSLLAGLD